MLDKHCQRSPQTGQPGSNQTSQSIFVSSHFHSKKLPVTLCYGAFWNENAYFVYANSVAGSIRPFVAGFQVTGDRDKMNCHIVWPFIFIFCIGKHRNFENVARRSHWFLFRIFIIVMKFIVSHIKFVLKLVNCFLLH